MRNVFLFIRRYFNFLFFICLQIICIVMIVQYNKYHNAIGSGIANEVTGKINTKYNQIDYYLQLKKINEQLIKDNETLRNKLLENFPSPDTINKTVADSIPYDTLGSKRKWLYMQAKVVSNSVTAQNNFIVLSRGSSQQLAKDCGVVDPNNGIVGIVTEVSSNYAVVMSLLHKDSKISVKLKKGGEGGQVFWDGTEPNRLSLSGIKQSAQVKKGDSILTSGMTTTFPYGLLVGTIDEIKQDKSSNNFLIKIKSAANFYNLQYVYAIDNLQKDEINKMLEKAINKTNN
jgi:rod shape-determining protein MreC